MRASSVPTPDPHALRTAWSIALAAKAIDPSGDPCARFMLRSGLKHLFLRLAPPGESSHAQEIHGMPVAMRGAKSLGPDITFGGLASDALLLSRGARWYKLVMYESSGPACHADERLAGQWPLFAGSEADALRRWTLALHWATLNNEASQPYKLAGPNCNTAARWLCRAMDLDPGRAAPVRSLGYGVPIRPLVEPGAADAFRQICGTRSVAELRASQAALTVVLDAELRAHYQFLDIVMPRPAPPPLAARDF